MNGIVIKKKGLGRVDELVGRDLSDAQRRGCEGDE